MKQDSVKMVKKKKNKGLVLTVLLFVILIVIIALITIMIRKYDNNKNIVSENEMQEVESTIDELINAEDAYIIETPYCSLYYPLKWKEQLRVEQLEEDLLMVKFYGMVEGKEDQHLFDINFNASGEIAIGSIMTEEIGMDLSMSYGKLTIDESWSEEEANIIYAMQEDVNYLLGMLEREQGFEPVK